MSGPVDDGGRVMVCICTARKKNYIVAYLIMHQSNFALIKVVWLN